MKIKYLLTSLLAAVALVTACENDEIAQLDQVKVSQSYIALPVEGGNVDITVNATSAWAIEDVPSWLTVEPASGSKGETTVRFSAPAATETNESILHLTCDGATQLITVLQMAEKVDLPISTCAEVLAGEDSKMYRVKGTCTAIANTEYGNWYITDETGSVYVYGTLDASGAAKNFLSLGIEVGDIVTVEGPRSTYGSVVELVDVTVISIEKSLIKVEEVSPEDALLPIEGGEFAVSLTVKGEGVSVEIPEDAKAWLSVASVNVSGTDAVVVFNAASNEGGDRSTDLTFYTNKAGKTYSAVTSLSQKGAIIEASIAEFLAAEEGQTQYRVKGVIKSITVSSQYHNADITVVSTTGDELLLYRTVSSEGNIEDLGLTVRDIVTVVGKRSSHSGTPQMAQGGVLESYDHYEGKTIPEFLALTTSDTNLYTVYGKIVEVTDLSESFNNVCLTIEDEEGNQLYIYRCKAYDGINVATVNPEVGGYVAVCGKYGEYKGAKQMASGGLILRYYKPEPGTDPEPDPGTDPEPDPSAADISFTDSFLPASYPTEETAVTSGEYGLAIYNVANYGNGIQMKKGGSYIYNTTAFGKIKSIKLNVPDGKTWYKDNVKLYAGSSANPTAEIALASSDETGSVYDLSAGDYSYIKIENPSNYAVYMKSIDIYLAK